MNNITGIVSPNPLEVSSDGPMFAAEIRKRRVQSASYSLWRWHLDEVFVRINGETHYLWRAVDYEGEVLEVFATKHRDRKAARTVRQPLPNGVNSPRESLYRF